MSKTEQRESSGYVPVSANARRSPAPFYRSRRYQPSAGAVSLSPGLAQRCPPSINENLIAKRHRVWKAGSIVFSGAAIDCTIRNLSETGAALEVVIPLFITDRGCADGSIEAAMPYYLCIPHDGPDPRYTDC